MFKKKQNLCLDKGYDFQETKDDVIKKGYCPHIRHRGEQSTTKRSNHHIKRRRWMLRELTPGTTGSENFWSDTKRS